MSLRARAGWPLGTLAAGVLALYVAFANYGFAGELSGGDAGLAWAFPAAALRHVAGVYVNGPGLGYNGATGLAAAFPALTLASALHGLGIPTPLVARLMIALYFFVAMTGMLKLCQMVLPPDPQARAATLLAALFYGINRYTVLLYSTAQTYFPLVYSALPWLVYGVVLGCEGRRGRGVVVVAAALLWAGGAGSNPALFGVALCALVAGAVLEAAHGVPWRRVVTVAGGGGALGLGLCAWWILPLFTGLGAGLDTLSAAGVPNWAGLMSERSSFLNLFKLDGYTGAELLPFASWYASPLGSVMGYIPLAVALAGFGVYRRRFSAAALAAFAAAAFLSKGVHGPFGGVYGALLAHVPGFTIFRSPYVKWIALESVLLALLFGFGTAGVLSRASRLNMRVPWLAPAALAAMLVAVVAYPWPAYAGRMLVPDYKGVGFISNVPAAYAQVAALERARGGGRTIVFNVGAPPYPRYRWNYFGDDPLALVLDGPVAPFDTLLPAAPQLPEHALAAALHSLGVCFIAVHHDVLNVAPSPQASVLVQAGAAALLYQSPELDLYALVDAVEPPATILHAPLVALERLPATDDARFSELSPGRLDPNVGLLLPGGPFAVLAPLGERDARVAENLGWIRDVTDDPASGPPGARVAFVQSNPLAVAESEGECGVRSALRLASPVRWRLGGHDLGGFDATLCLARRRAGQIEVAGGLRDDSRQTGLVNGAPLWVAVPQTGPPVGFAIRRLLPGMPFEFTIPAGADAVDLILPPSTRREEFYATLRSTGGEQLGFGGPSVDGAVILAQLDSKPAARRLFAFLSTADPRAFVSLQRLRTLPFSTVAVEPQPFELHVNDALLEPFDGGLAGAGAVRRLTATPVPRGFAMPVRLHWEPDDATARRDWSAAGDTVRLRSNGPPSEVHLEGTLAANARYELRFAYRATGYAELWIFTGGSDADHIAHLTADGSWHTFDSDIYPLPISNGSYIVRLRSSGGAVEARGVHLAAAGPNGAELAWRSRPLGGTLSEAARPFPWLVKMRLAGCAPCAVRLDAADLRNWRVLGASVVGRYSSQGGAKGAWAAIATGAATFLLRAAPGERGVRIVYLPAVFAATGLLIALVAVASLIVLAARKRLDGAAFESFSEPARSRAAYRALGAFALATAGVGSVASGAGDVLADVLFALCVLTSAIEWTRRRSAG